MSEVRFDGTTHYQMLRGLLGFGTHVGDLQNPFAAGLRHCVTCVQDDLHRIFGGADKRYLLQWSITQLLSATLCIGLHLMLMLILCAFWVYGTSMFLPCCIEQVISKFKEKSRVTDGPGLLPIYIIMGVLGLLYIAFCIPFLPVALINASIWILFPMQISWDPMSESQGKWSTEPVLEHPCWSAVDVMLSMLLSHDNNIVNKVIQILSALVVSPLLLSVVVVLWPFGFFMCHLHHITQIHLASMMDELAKSRLRGSSSAGLAIISVGYFLWSIPFFLIGFVFVLPVCFHALLVCPEQQFEQYCAQVQRATFALAYVTLGIAKHFGHSSQKNWQCAEQAVVKAWPEFNVPQQIRFFLWPSILGSQSLVALTSILKPLRFTRLSSAWPHTNKAIAIMLVSHIWTETVLLALPLVHHLPHIPDRFIDVTTGVTQYQCYIPIAFSIMIAGAYCSLGGAHCLALACGKTLKKLEYRQGSRLICGRTIFLREDSNSDIWCVPKGNWVTLSTEPFWRQGQVLISISPDFLEPKVLKVQGIPLQESGDYNGHYLLQAGAKVAGKPIWKHSCRELSLYSNAGRWTIGQIPAGGTDGDHSDLAISIVSVNSLPHTVRQWAIIGVSITAGQILDEVKLPLEDFAPRLFLSGTADCSGTFHMSAGLTKHGQPVWRLLQERRTVWLVFDINGFMILKPVDADTACPIEFDRNMDDSFQQADCQQCPSSVAGEWLRYGEAKHIDGNSITVRIVKLRCESGEVRKEEAASSSALQQHPAGTSVVCL